MNPSPRYGFQETGHGIHYWFIDREGVANLLGPATSLEHLQDKNEFRLQTVNGPGYRLILNPEDVVEFRRLGGVVKPFQVSAPAIQPPAQWYFAREGQRFGPWTETQLRARAARRQIRPADQIWSTASPGWRPAIFCRVCQLPYDGKSPSCSECGSYFSEPPPAQAAMPPTPVGPSARQPGMPLQWHGIGHTVQAGRYAIVDPLTYFSNGAASEDEASSIDLSLPVGKPVEEPPGALGYWPQYRGISPDQRANYLAWLAGQRNAPLQDAGYAFLYFYGLERRILVDKQDINPVSFEVVRLLKLYTFSGSFTGYLSRFLAYVIAQTGVEKLREEWFNPIFEDSPIQPDEEILALALAWHVKRGQPLSAQWAMRLAKQHPLAPRSVVVERAPQQFQALFAKKYHDRYDNGLLPSAARSDRVIHYSQPASPSLLAQRDRDPAWGAPVSIPNVLGLQSQFAPLVKIWSECIDDLKAFGRQLAKGVEVNSRAAFEALPPELKTETEHPDKPRWDGAVKEHTTEDGFVFLPVLRLAAIQGLATNSRLTLKQSDSLAQTAESAGYCIEPDARITCRAYSADELVALFRPEAGAMLPADKRYASAAIMLELQLAVAAADGHVSEEAVSITGPFLEGQFRLDQAEVRRLKQLKGVFLKQHPSLSRVSKRMLRALSLPQREVLSRFLLAVAVGNGMINEPTIKALRGAYRALGVHVAQLNTAIDALKGPGRRPIAPDTEVPLNQDRVRQIIADGQIVANMLRPLWQQDDEQPPKPIIDRFPGLHDRFQILLTELLNQDEWSAADFEGLVRARGLMPNDAMTQINEWAEETWKDILIEEEGNTVLIHRSLTQGRTCSLQ